MAPARTCDEVAVGVDSPVLVVVRAGSQQLNTKGPGQMQRPRIRGVRPSRSPGALRLYGLFVDRDGSECHSPADDLQRLVRHRALQNRVRRFESLAVADRSSGPYPNDEPDDVLPARCVLTENAMPNRPTMGSLPAAHTVTATRQDFQSVSLT